ncbi:MAG: FMN-binding protein, partial [Sedimentisphaerales bacterium]|nr:FMN-binding protein [Sedimentisphaerales bacterium]
MKDAPWYPVVYMFVITAVFSSVLIGFSRATREHVEANQRLAFEKAVVSVLPINLPANAGNLAIHQAFVSQVETPTNDTGGAYVLRRDGGIVAYALPFEGQGFWAPIKGILGLKDDRRTITGFAIYEQKETPGLGAEINQPKFKNQFPGKKLAKGEPALGIVSPAATPDENEVYAVTGATQTSTRLEKLLNENIAAWRARL